MHVVLIVLQLNDFVLVIASMHIFCFSIGFSQYVGKGGLINNEYLEVQMHYGCLGVPFVVQSVLLC